MTSLFTSPSSRSVDTIKLRSKYILNKMYMIHTKYVTRCANNELYVLYVLLMCIWNRRGKEMFSNYSILFRATTISI